MNNKVIIRIGIGIVAVALVAFAFWHGAKNTQTASTSPTPSISGSPAPAASPLPITYAAVPGGWQTYSSTSLGFKASFPKDWKSSDCGDGCIAFGPVGAQQPVIGVSVTPDTLVNILAQAAPYQISKDDVKVNTLTWTKIVLQQPETNELFVSHFIEHGGKVYEFGLATQDKATVDIYGQMIKSFVFLK